MTRYVLYVLSAERHSAISLLRGSATALQRYQPAIIEWLETNQIDHHYGLEKHPGTPTHAIIHLVLNNPDDAVTFRLMFGFKPESRIR